MMIIFDYIFYRAYRYYNKKEKIAKSRAAMILSLYQSLAIVCVFGISNFFITIPKIQKEYFGIIPIILMFVNYRIYEVDFSPNKFESLWGNETKKDRFRRGILFWGSLVFMILLIIFMGSIPK